MSWLQSSHRLRSKIDKQLNTIEVGGAFCGHTISEDHIDPGLDIAGLGRFSTPPYERDVELMTSRGTRFGDSCWTIDAKDIVFRHPGWRKREASILDNAYAQLGMSGRGRDLRAYLHGLILFRPGYSGRVPMESMMKQTVVTQAFAHMMISLPSQHQGGNVKCKLDEDDIRELSTHTNSEWGHSHTTWFREAYADIAPIESGTKVILLYSLVCIGYSMMPVVHRHESTKAALKLVLEEWTACALKEDRMPKHLVYILSRDYGEPAHRLNSLGGVDAARVRCLSRLAKQLDWLCLLTTVERNESGTMAGNERSGYERELDDSDTKLDAITTFDGAAFENGYELDEDDEAIFVPPRPWDEFEPDEDDDDAEDDDNMGYYSRKFRKTALLLLPKCYELDFYLHKMDEDEKITFLREELPQAEIDFAVANSACASATTLQQGQRTALEALNKIDRTCEIVLRNSYTALLEDVIQCCTRIAHSELLTNRMSTASTSSIHAICQAVRRLFASHSFETLRPYLDAAFASFPNIIEAWHALQSIRTAAVLREHDVRSSWATERLKDMLRNPVLTVEASQCLTEMICSKTDSTWLHDWLLPILKAHAIHTIEGHRVVLDFIDKMLLALRSNLIDKESARRFFDELYPVLCEQVQRMIPMQIAALYAYALDPSMMAHSRRKIQLVEALTAHDSATWNENTLTALSIILCAAHSNGVELGRRAYQDATIAILDRAIKRGVGHEPTRPDWRRPKRGCGRRDCDDLDLFLRDRQRQSVSFYLLKKDKEHLELVLSGSRDGHRYDVTAKAPDTRAHERLLSDNLCRRMKDKQKSQPHMVKWTVKVTKRTDAFDSDHGGWSSRVAAFQQTIQSMVPEATLRVLLGPRYEEIVQLQAVKTATAHLFRHDNAAPRLVPPTSGVAQGLPPSMTGEQVKAMFQEYTTKRAQRIPDTDPHMVRMRALLSQVQQQTEQMKHLQQAAVSRIQQGVAQRLQSGTSTMVALESPIDGSADNHKRKEGPENNQENIPSAKRMAIRDVIDLT